MSCYQKVKQDLKSYLIRTYRQCMSIPPNGRAKVTVTYTSPLSVVNEQWSFLIPAAMTPLYNLDYHFEDQDREVTDFPVVRVENCHYSIGFTIQIES
jgi:hypothetical protein